MAEETDEQRQEREEREAREKDTAAKAEELGEGGKRALEAERKRARTLERELRDLQAKVKERDDADKSEVERLQGQVTDLTKRADAAEAKATRFEVAAEKGLSLAQARRLVGSTKEELEADAADMRSELGLDKEEEKGKEEGKGEERGRPKESLRTGASPEGDEEPDPGKLADSILSSPF